MNQIPDNEIVFRKKQNASRLFYTLKYLYLNKINIRERKIHLKNDFSEKEKSVLRYFKENPLNKMFVLFYKIGLINVFDLLMSIVFRIKDVLR